MVGILYSVFFTSIYYLGGHRDGWNHVKFVLYRVLSSGVFVLYGEEARVGGEGPGGWALEVK